MLYAAIDIGTVTCRLLVCKFERGVQQELVRECRIVNLGIGVSKTGILQEDAIERVVSCVKEYCAERRGAFYPDRCGCYERLS